MCKLTISGLRLYGYHGTEEAEQREGQEYEFSCQIESEAPVDYRNIVKVIEEVNREPCELIEHLAEKIAERIKSCFLPNRVKVWVKKPYPPIPYSLEYILAEAEG
jgi:dihydroneopterin aldolase